MKTSIWDKTKLGRKSLRELKDYNLVGNLTISEVERSKSNNSRCHLCDKRIGKNTLRGIATREDEEKHFTMRFVYCSKCTIVLLSEGIKQMRTIKKLIKDRMRTRSASYKKEYELQLKDELLGSLSDEDKIW